MAEVSGAAKAVVGPARAATSADVKITWVGFGIAVLAAAAVVWWAGQANETRVMYWAHDLTEAEGPALDFQDHLATRAELSRAKPVLSPVRYPDRTAPGITRTIHQGFATAEYRPVDPEFFGGGGRTVPW